MRILVTGGCGFIGSHICDALKDHEVLALDNLVSGKKEHVTCPVEVVDIMDADALRKVFSEFRPDAVVHAAGQVQLRRSLEDPVFDAEQNIIGTINVLRAAKGIRKFIYTSTGGARYGEPERLPVKETDPVKPLSPYGISKHTAEHYIEAFAQLRGFDYLLLCFGNVYGPRDNPDNKRVITTFVRQLLANERPVIHGDGEQTRDFLYVGDIGRVVRDNIGKETAHKIFNLGSGEQTSVNRIYEIVESQIGTGMEPQRERPVEGEIRDIVLDISRARAHLGLEPTGIEEGVRRTIEWYRSR